MTRALHHMAFRCRDSETTRQFYEDVIGLPLAATVEVSQTASGRKVELLHTFFRLEDGGHIAFFEVPEAPFDFKPQHDFDLHLALEASQSAIDRAVEIARRRGLEMRGPSNHDFITSYYFRDPDGYVVELACKAPDHDSTMALEATTARPRLADWTARQRAKVPAQ